ncbi:hypothetical protein AQUCO_48800001v1, partial [Aquilegia coerulea]
MEQYRYKKSRKEQLETLKNKTEELVARVNDANRMLQIIEEDQEKTRTSEVELWLTKSSDAITHAESIDDEAKAAKRCLNGVIPNCCSRLNLEKRISKLSKEVTDLFEKAGHFTDTSPCLPVQKMGIMMSTAKMTGKTTAEKNLQMVWECLMGDAFVKIGVFGMGGVGKTTMMKNINNLLLEQKIRFNKVIWVTVSKDATVQKLQSNIAMAVKVDLSKEHDEAIMAALLLKAFHRMGRFVLILDDMWEEFSLHDLGVPMPTKENGCKLVLTTRSSEVCHKMECESIIKAELLSEEEGWELFINKYGADLPPGVEEVARDIVKECACLPLAIITTAVAMRGKVDIQDWKGSLTDLQERTSLFNDMEAKVIERLKFSYNHLDKISQNCFLYCALYPEDWEIKEYELINYWIIEGLIQGRSSEDEIDCGYRILNILKSCCMLEELYKDKTRRGLRKYVKMHDLIRDMALNIGRTNPKLLIKAGAQYRKNTAKEDWPEDLERASFMVNAIEVVTISPECPRLLTLFLAKNPLTRMIASDFFLHMKGLTVLNLCFTWISFLPESISNLVNLRGLLLSHCYSLRAVPSLSKLQSLIVLKLNYTSIEELPQGMEMLINLKCLNLRSTKQLQETIPVGLLRNLSSLQELDLSKIGVDKIYAEGRGNMFVGELLSLKKMEKLLIQFRDLRDFNTYARARNYQGLREFKFVVGSMTFWPSKRGISIFHDMDGFNYHLSLPKATEFLSIWIFPGLRRLSELACLKDMRELRECCIRNCNAMDCILSSEDGDVAHLQWVEKLRVESCFNIGTICKGFTTPGTLSCLKILHIDTCWKLKYLTSLTFLQHLHNLEEIEVKDCRNMEELVSL